MHAVFNVLAPMICHIWFSLRINEHCFIARDFIAKGDEMSDFIPLTFYFDIYTCKAHTFSVLSVGSLTFPPVLFFQTIF